MVHGNTPIRAALCVPRTAWAEQKQPQDCEYSKISNLPENLPKVFITETVFQIFSGNFSTNPRPDQLFCTIGFPCGSRMKTLPENGNTSNGHRFKTILYIKAKNAAVVNIILICQNKRADLKKCWKILHF